jgi:hypothetical protein
VPPGKEDNAEQGVDNRPVAALTIDPEQRAEPRLRRIATVVVYQRRNVTWAE